VGQGKEAFIEEELKPDGVTFQQWQSTQGSWVRENYPNNFGGPGWGGSPITAETGALPSIADTVTQPTMVTAGTTPMPEPMSEPPAESAAPSTAEGIQESAAEVAEATTQLKEAVTDAEATAQAADLPEANSLKSLASEFRSFAARVDKVIKRMETAASRIEKEDEKEAKAAAELALKKADHAETPSDDATVLSEVFPSASEAGIS
jgi:hypothetical protein